MLLFAAREGDIRTFDASGVPGLYVRGLDRDGAIKLLSAGAGIEIAPDVAPRLVEGTEGNPLALLELPNILSTEQLSGSDPLPVPLPTSEGLERAFLQRVRQLPTKTQTLLLVGAVDDTGSWATVLGAAKLLGIAAEDLDSAERAGLLMVHEGELEFRHPLVRSAIYQGATTSERQIAHRALAKVLRDEADADRRAWHLAAATVEPDEAVVRELEEAVLAKEERIAREWLRSQETFAAHSGTPWAQALVAHCRALNGIRRRGRSRLHRSACQTRPFPPSLRAGPHRARVRHIPSTSSAQDRRANTPPHGLGYLRRPQVDSVGGEGEPRAACVG